MKIIALFFPALIAVYMNSKHLMNNLKDGFSLFFTYGMFAIAINITVMGVITYVLGLDGLTISVFESFSFFMIYTVLSCATSVFMGMLVKILRKTSSKEDLE